MSLIIHRVAQYARFSSDNQRTESIDAQLRAMSQFCKQHWQIVATYTDEARSETTDNRPQFQQMMLSYSKQKSLKKKGLRYRKNSIICITSYC